MRISFRSLVDSEEFQSACSEAGYSAFWDSGINAVVMEDAVGSHCFKPGIRASRVMELLRDTLASKVFEAVLVPLMEIGDEEIF